MQAYIFRGNCTRVIDGDTIVVDIDVGFGLRTTQHIRLHGIDAPEVRTKDLEEKERGYIASEFVSQMVMNKDLMIQTYKAETFGRYLAKVFVPELADPDTGKVNYICLNELLVSEGLAVPFMTNVDLLN